MKTVAHQSKKSAWKARETVNAIIEFKYHGNVNAFDRDFGSPEDFSVQVEAWLDDGHGAGKTVTELRQMCSNWGEQ